MIHELNEELELFYVSYILYTINFKKYKKTIEIHQTNAILLSFTIMVAPVQRLLMVDVLIYVSHISSFSFLFILNFIHVVQSHSKNCFVYEVDKLV